MYLLTFWCSDVSYGCNLFIPLWANTNSNKVYSFFHILNNKQVCMFSARIQYLEVCTREISGQFCSVW